MRVDDLVVRVRRLEERELGHAPLGDVPEEQFFVALVRDLDHAVGALGPDRRLLENCFVEVASDDEVLRLHADVVDLRLLQDRVLVRVGKPLDGVVRLGLFLDDLVDLDPALVQLLLHRCAGETVGDVDQVEALLRVLVVGSESQDRSVVVLRHVGAPTLLVLSRLVLVRAHEILRQLLVVAPEGLGSGGIGLVIPGELEPRHRLPRHARLLATERLVRHRAVRVVIANDHEEYELGLPRETLLQRPLGERVELLGQRLAELDLLLRLGASEVSAEAHGEADEENGQGTSIEAIHDDRGIGGTLATDPRSIALGVHRIPILLRGGEATSRPTANRSRARGWGPHVALRCFGNLVTEIPKSPLVTGLDAPTADTDRPIQAIRQAS